MKLTDGRLVSAEVKDARNLVFYADGPQIYAVLDGHTLLDPRSFSIADGLLTLKRPPAFDLKFLVAA